MVSPLITEIGYLVELGPPAELYERLNSRGYLSDRADQKEVNSILETVMRSWPSEPDFGDEPWRHVEDRLAQGGFLSDAGLRAARHFIMRYGREFDPANWQAGRRAGR